MNDIKLIAALLVMVVVVMTLDDGASQRWCETYQFCEDQK